MDKYEQQRKQNESKKQLNPYWTLLQYYLKPIAPFLETGKKAGITEICVNRFDEIYIEQRQHLKVKPHWDV